MILSKEFCQLLSSRIVTLIRETRSELKVSVQLQGLLSYRNFLDLKFYFIKHLDKTCFIPSGSSYEGGIRHIIGQ